MFDGLLKSKFYSKCKSAIKMTKTRIEIIRKKRNAMQKYLRNDIADLLKNGLDINAYGRADGLLIELNQSSCYDLIAQFSVFISSHLAAMSKQRECPEECREAVSSLMLAAARFADLPELRELRTVFSERYESSLDVYINKEFVEKLKSALPSKDMKLQLMQDIAVQSGITWNSKALESNLCNVPASIQDITKESNGNEYNLHNGINGSVKRKDPVQNKECGDNLNPRECTSPERKDVHSSSGGKEAMKDECRLPSRKENAVPQRDNIVRPSHKTPVVTPPVKDIQVDTIGRNQTQNQPNTPRSTFEEKVENGKLFNYKLFPPPYTKSENDNEKNCDHDNSVGDAKPKPKSVRRRHTKPPSAHANVGGSEINESVNQDKATHGQRILKFLDKGDHEKRDEEERTMDRLLFHYSRKKAPHDMDDSGSVLKPPPQLAATEKSKASKHGNRDAPNRLSSLPVELTSPTKTPKRHFRASSLQPEMLISNGHVHPKLPDYDDFMARFAAFKGN
ncbi:putative Regulator of Vps4 activity in the MVB pathway protein [Abeliophyllum distichum]|uniref:Regulator of Vps4 activity in the MVB pathway protein n=1 Tax=Abeliophyllum distichum TaxID=126358 RepID=A0ABD1RYP9_9LAMI